MNSPRVALVVLLFLINSAFIFGQGSSVKRFNKDGLLFEYPSEWVLQDTSNADAQQMALSKTDSNVQIRVFVYRNQLTTPEESAEAKRVLVDPYVASAAKQFEQMGARPEQEPASTEISHIKSDGMKVRAVLDEPGAAEIYWTTVGQRLVVLTFFGPDKARSKAMTAWDSVRNSLQVEAPKPRDAKPSEKPKQ